jgi:phenylalanyl-tRNA synthetase beta chain
MKFTFSWLKDFLETDYSLDDICEVITSLGLEVESVVNQSEIFAPFIVGYIEKVKKHPDADKLQICDVNIGSKIIQIVCGGSNARAGIKVVVAQENTIIPTSKLKMKKSSIRGVESNGMLVSKEEMGLGDDDVHHGIIELTEDAIIGSNFAPYLGVDEQIIEVGITPNRSDCLGVYGIARDLAAAGVGTLKPLTISLIEGDYISPISVDLQTNNCTHFIGRYIKNVKNGKSPDWLKFRLQSVGSKSISALVDITNYLTLSFGRPMHVYDADKITQQIIVREALKNENLLALNDNNYVLTGGETVIATSDNKILGLGGIIGGANCAVSMDTKNIFLEIANFDAVNIAITGRKHQIDTDARYRFERIIDPSFLEKGELIATDLILKLSGGQPSKTVTQGKNIYQDKFISFSEDMFFKKSGFKLSIDKIINILTGLGFEITNNNDILNAKVPSYRPDISIKEDLVEEILRIYGYDNIPREKLPAIKLEKSNNEDITVEKNIRRSLAANGYDEIVSWSFMDKQHAALFIDEFIEESILNNPISSELDYMRPTILSNLILAAKKNLSRGFNNQSLFEIGPIFNKIQQQVVSGIRIGNDCDKNIYSKPRKYDVFDIKKDIYDFMTECNFNPEKIMLDNKNIPDFLHPGRSSILKIGKTILGYFGELHPIIAKNLNIKHRVNLFELVIENIPKAKHKKGKKPVAIFSDYQSVTRDFAFIFNIESAADDIIKTIANIDKKLIKNVEIFDIFTNDVIGIDKKSMTISVVMQSQDRTLIDDEIDNLYKNIIQTISSKFNTELRSV